MERAKALIHRLDIEGSLQGWLQEWQLPLNRNLSGLRVRLSEGPPFRAQDYVNAQQQRTEWIVSRRPRMVQFIRQAKPIGRIGGTVRSYILQEYEARSRCEKIRVAEERGHVWFSLQHDGIGIGLIKENTNPYQFASTLTK